MEKSVPENSSKRRRVITELVQGREFATQLRILLDNNKNNSFIGDDCSVSAEQLVMKILGSFTETLSVLSSGDGSAGGRQIPASAQVGSSCSGDRESQDSGESMKRPTLVDRRGRYKRRKSSESRITISPTIEDGYAWRKYGQKDILNDKYPRCYFRCTHKNDQGCKALKQVQKIDEGDHTVYRITYFGQHVCSGTKNSLFQPISENESTKSFMLSFESSKIPSNNKQLVHNPPLKEETNSSMDSVLWKDLMLESSDHEDDVLSSVHSCASNTSIGLDMGDLIRCVDFDNNFRFDEIGFF
ncbi:hypothetical protein LguiA_034747 [Lonicera macranthoides]